MLLVSFISIKTEPSYAIEYMSLSARFQNAFRSIFEFVLAEFSRLTLFRLLISIFWFLCADLATEIKSDAKGLEWLLLGVFGFFAGILLSWMAISGMARFSPFPVCKRGKCRRFDDYDWIKGTFYGCVGWRMYYNRCKCGDFYLRRGSEFREVLQDGTQKDYVSPP
jgi:hypothetical protein